MREELVNSGFANPDLLNLALVSKELFLDIALDALWRKQSNLYNMISLLPSDLWEVDETSGHSDGVDRIVGIAIFSATNN